MAKSLFGNLDSGSKRDRIAGIVSGIIFLIMGEQSYFSP